MKDTSIYRWVKASERVPTITKYTVVRQNNWAGTCYTDSAQSLQRLCDKEVMLFFEDLEWLEEINTQERETAEQILSKFLGLPIESIDIGRKADSKFDIDTVLKVIEYASQFSTSVPKQGASEILRMFTTALDLMQDVRLPVLQAITYAQKQSATSVPVSKTAVDIAKEINDNRSLSPEQAAFLIEQYKVSDEEKDYLLNALIEIFKLTLTSHPRKIMFQDIANDAIKKYTGKDPIEFIPKKPQ